ncbi:MAG: DUF5658 family protein [Methanocella sp.]
MSETRYVASLMLVLMGSMDCLTTVVGTVYFGAQELNPLVAGLIYTNLHAFVFVKLAVTVGVGVAFVWIERTLLRTVVRDKAFRAIHTTFRVASIGMITFLSIVVINNFIVLLRTAIP